MIDGFVAAQACRETAKVPGVSIGFQGTPVMRQTHEPSRHCTREALNK
jgi:hypothetical protein